MQEALAANQQVWGGWVVGPTIIGPEEFAQAGYDYVGFDVQHGYLDDADVALLLRRLEHVPIATAVRLPSADPAPIGRVLDAGADAVIIAMIESAEAAAAAVAATRYAPTGVRSFGPLRADIGLDPAEHEAGASVFAMIETARGLSALDEICAVPGLAGVYVGPADLAISLGENPITALSAPCGARCRGTYQVGGSGRGAGCRHPRQRGQARKGHGRAGLSDDHSGIGVSGPAARRVRASEGGPVTIGGTRRAGYRCGPRAGGGDRRAAARRRLSGRRVRRADRLN